MLNNMPNNLNDKLKEALKKYSINGLSIRLGVHKNTIRRWMKKGVPDNYYGDFLRLFGGSDDGLGGDHFLDQYYTNPEIVDHCIITFLCIARTLDIDLKEYCIIEPSVGYGDFYKGIDITNRMGFDIDPKAKGYACSYLPIIDKSIKTMDYLVWNPEPEDKRKFAVLGNPPFGLRGHLALQFINHSYPFADLVGFILPPSFDSDGRGAPCKRVKGYKLAYTERLPYANSFYYPSGQDVKISTVFQVWTKVNTHKIKPRDTKTCNQFIRVYSVSGGSESYDTRNMNMHDKCDLYFPDSCFRGMRVYDKFSDLPHKRGYGVKILKAKKAVKKIFEQCSLEDVAYRSTNGALNLRTSLIQSILINGGIEDEVDVFGIYDYEN